MSDVKPHPIVLESLMFTRSVVVAIPGHQVDPSMVKKGPENSLNVTKVENDRGLYSATMKMVMNLDGETTYPYLLDMECIGTLRADDTLSHEEALRGAYITANSVLYGAIREAVAWITGRQPYGSLVLGLSVLRSTPQPEAK